MAIKRKNSNNEWVVDQRAIETTIIDLMGNFESNNVEGALRELAEKSEVSDVEYGNVAPTNENVSLWVDTSADAGVSSLLSDSLILEFRNMFKDLSSQIQRLKEENLALERRVAYLEQNSSGGGGSPGGGDTPPSGDTPGGDIVVGTQLTFEDGSIMTFEDGSIMTFEGEEEVVVGTQLTFEDGSIMTFEDGSIMIFEDTNGTTKVQLTFEDGKVMTFEDNAIMTFEDNILRRN